MKEILTYVMLDGSNEHQDIFDKSIDVENMVSTARVVANDSTFETFFEEPHEDLIVSVRFEKHSKKIEADIHLRDAFYHKHIGKYMDSDKILLDYMMALEKSLDAVCWKTAAGHGCGGGCHG